MLSISLILMYHHESVRHVHQWTFIQLFIVSAALLPHILKCLYMNYHMVIGLLVGPPVHVMCYHNKDIPLWQYRTSFILRVYTATVHSLSFFFCLYPVAEGYEAWQQHRRERLTDSLQPMGSIKKSILCSLRKSVDGEVQVAGDVTQSLVRKCHVPEAFRVQAGKIECACALGVMPSVHVSDVAGPAVHLHVITDCDGHVHTCTCTYIMRIDPSFRASC